MPGDEGIRNATDPHAQDFVVNEFLLLFILKTFPQYTLYLYTDRKHWCFQSVFNNTNVCRSHH